MILLSYGTRPEYIKIKPLIKELKTTNIPFKVLFTGQHENISDGEYDFKIDILDNGNNRLDSIVSSCLNLPNEYFDGVKYVLVQGDTSSVLGLALTASHRKIKIIHLEAGLRTYDKNNPFPEESNRRMVSVLADIHLCPTESNESNLCEENIEGDIYVVGNTGLDNLVKYKKECEYSNKILVTLHRRENHDKLFDWFANLNSIANRYPEYEFIFPLHPNPEVQKYRLLLDDVTVIDPLSHEDLIKLLVKTRMVITDSGGLQEECSFFNKKCLVCREETERPESLGITSFLVKSPKQLDRLFRKHIVDYKISKESPYGDGTASKQIIKILKKIYRYEKKV